MKTVNIKGKEYVEVNERIKYFREHYKWWSLITDIIEITENRAVMKASILNESQIVVATWIAYEDKWSSFINKTSYIENCETSAWGRALWNLWIWIDASIASSEEVQNAILNQNKKDALPPFTKAQFKEFVSVINESWYEQAKKVFIEDYQWQYDLSNATDKIKYLSDYTKANQEVSEEIAEQIWKWIAPWMKTPNLI